MRLWCELTPNCASSALSASGETPPLNLAIIDTAGFPGIMRGNRKLSVRATHSVSAKKARRRSANLMPFLLVLSSSVRSPPASLRRCSTDRPAGGEATASPPATDSPSSALLLWGQVHHHLPPVRVVVGRRLRVRVARGRPAGEGPGVVLEPVDGLRDRDHRNVLEHHELKFGDDLLLRRGIGRLRELFDQLVDRRVLVPLEVRAGRRADRCRVRRVQPLAELVVRTRAAGLGTVAELVLPGVQLVLVLRLRQALLLDLDADCLKV